MSSKVFSAAIIGLDAQLIEAEAEVSYGLRRFSIVGLADKAIEESKERVASALKSAGFRPPQGQPQRVLINLAPANLKKEGSLYDLPIALSYLLASEQVKFNPNNKLFVGELALDGSLRPIAGALAFALLCKEKGWNELFLPRENAAEAALLKDIKIIAASSLSEIVRYLENKEEPAAVEPEIEKLLPLPEGPVDLAWIKGQQMAKRALEIAAAGNHNLFFEGPPGAGKTLLAKALPSVLPPLSFEESIEVTKIYSVSGLLSRERPFINTRPFRSPHHTASEAALIGGGSPPRPGEITLAHRGVLFLDEFPEFHRDVLESLRQPLEEGAIAISRSRHRLSFPAKFMLVAASNPCPCGYRNSPEQQCTCTFSQVAGYRKKLSGPLMDRIDLFVNVPQLKYEKLTEPELEGSSAKLKEKIIQARKVQGQRFSEEKKPGLVNAEMNMPQIKKYCQVDSKAGELLRKYVDSGRLSARGYHRVLKTARTIADLEASENIRFDNVSEALMYRLRSEH